MFSLGESTLALDEEILQVLDAADAAKTTAQSACQAAVSITAQQVPVSLASAVRAPKPAGQEPQGAPGVQEKDNGHSSGSKRTGWRADCEDLAQRLLFSEDSEETENGQANPEPPACTKRMPCQETGIGPQLGISSK